MILLLLQRMFPELNISLPSFEAVRVLVVWKANEKTVGVPFEGPLIIILC